MSDNIYELLEKLNKRVKELEAKVTELQSINSENASFVSDVERMVVEKLVNDTLSSKREDIATNYHNLGEAMAEAVKGKKLSANTLDLKLEE